MPFFLFFLRLPYYHNKPSVIIHPKPFSNWRPPTICRKKANTGNAFFPVAFMWILSRTLQPTFEPTLGRNLFNVTYVLIDLLKAVTSTGTWRLSIHVITRHSRPWKITKITERALNATFSHGQSWEILLISIFTEIVQYKSFYRRIFGREGK